MKEEYEVGKWYKNVEWESLAGKLNKVGKTMCFSEYINPKGEHFYRDFENSLSRTYIEIPVSEIQKYLPNRHKDKFSAMSKEQKNKILQLIQEI